MHKVLVNLLFKLAQEKSVLRRTDHPDMNIPVDWEVKQQTKPKDISYLNNFGPNMYQLSGVKIAKYQLLVNIHHSHP